MVIEIFVGILASLCRLLHFSFDQSLLDRSEHVEIRL